MTISVIIPTYKGENKIANILGALAKQTHKEFEVIVAIDGAVDNTEAIARQFTNMFQHIKIITQPNRGRAAIRNFGAKNATGELLVFYDDDMIPLPNSVEEHTNIHQKYTDILLAGNQQEQVAINKTDIQNYKATLTDQWTRKYVERITVLDGENLFFSASNCSVSKKTFDRLEGFDERLSDSEDYDIGLRALATNIKVLFDKENVAIHQDFITARSYVLRLRQYNEAHKMLARLHPGMRSGQNKSMPLFKRLFYAFFAWPVFLFLIDRYNIFFMLPRAARYRLYTFVIFSLSAVFHNRKI